MKPDEPGRQGTDASVPARTRRRPGTGTIRPYRPEDREAVREICRRTAYRNRGSAALFEDGELFADYWTSYYTDHEPESCLVVEEDGEVIGYLLGSVDTSRMIVTMARKIVPGILGRILWRLATLKYRSPYTRRTIRWMFFNSWREAPPVPLKEFPAHYHCNILPKGHGKGYYSAMALTFLDMLQERGVEYIHGQVEEFADRGVWRQMTSTYMKEMDVGDPVHLFSQRPSTFQRVVLGRKRPMVNRAWSTSVDEYRHYLEWMAQKYHM